MKSLGHSFKISLQIYIFIATFPPLYLPSYDDSLYIYNLWERYSSRPRQYNTHFAANPDAKNRVPSGCQYFTHNMTAE